MKKGQAGCVYIYKYKNVTPFGRILSGDRFKKTATFTNYIGAGWEMSDQRLYGGIDNKKRP